MNKAETILLTMKRLLKAYSEFKTVVREAEKFNTKDGPNMTPDEMNRFRHIAAGAYFISKGYEDYEVELFGNMKEIADFCRKFNWTDGDFDKANNIKGINIGKKLKYQGINTIFNYIFKNEIEPKRH